MHSLNRKPTLQGHIPHARKYQPTHHTHPRINQAVNLPTNPPTMYVIQQYSSTDSSKYSLVRTRTSQEQAGITEKQILYKRKEHGHLPQERKYSPRYKKTRPTQPPNPPRTNGPVHTPNAPNTMCYYSSTSIRTAANSCVWSVLDLYIEISIGRGAIDAGCGKISEDFVPS